MILLQKILRITFLTRKGWPVNFIPGEPFKNILRMVLVGRRIYRGTIDDWNREHNELRRQEIERGVMECEDANFERRKRK